MSSERLIIGPEHDATLLQKLGNVLRLLGYRVDNQWSGVAGSQDISHWEVASPKGVLVVEAETYVGLSVFGPQELVSELKPFFANAR
jgi:hypothetical protein